MKICLRHTGQRCVTKAEFMYFLPIYLVQKINRKLSILALDWSTVDAQIFIDRWTSLVTSLIISWDKHLKNKNHPLTSLAAGKKKKSGKTVELA